MKKQLLQACVAVMLTLGMVSCATNPKPIMVSVEEQLALLHAATTITVAEFVVQHPDLRQAIMRGSVALTKDLDAYTSHDISTLVARARARIMTLDIQTQEKIALDSLLTVLVPRIQQFVADHPQAMQAVVLEKQALSWVHDAADLAGK